ncbi:hypothetical protein PIB30_101467 [Stylosanthes scabra]|uniref:Uncharacterized protein n=1 Tax=Stylosanthes scabra TaxID=79078 RepID=A0ABU6ZWI9_9FABA|nr:hypothetical protein [Stylosanthes scabra]
MGWGFSLGIYFRLFRCRFELGKLAKHSFQHVWSSLSEDLSRRLHCRIISEVCPEYMIGFRMLCNEPELRRFKGVILKETLTQRDVWAEEHLRRMEEMQRQMAAFYNPLRPGSSIAVGGSGSSTAPPLPPRSP